MAGQASPPVRQRRWWSRLLIAAMHVAQPVERGWARYKTRFETILIPEAFHELLRGVGAARRRLLGRREVSTSGARTASAARSCSRASCR